MTTESIATRIIKKLKSFFATQIIEEEVRELEESTPPRKYVNVLFLDLVKKGICDIDLYRDDSLPMGFEGFEDALFENVAYAQVENRLREMITSTGPNGEQQINLEISDKIYLLC